MEYRILVMRKYIKRVEFTLLASFRVQNRVPHPIFGHRPYFDHASIVEIRQLAACQPKATHHPSQPQRTDGDNEFDTATAAP